MRLDLNLCRSAAFVLLSTLAIMELSPARAAYPERPITLIVPYPPGGATDMVARWLSNSIAQTLKTSVVVENKSGASGNIGMEYAARTPKDGYTLVMVSAGQTIAASYFKELRYDMQKDFTPVALAVLNQRMLVARNNAPFSTVNELIDYAKKHPGEVSYASFGNGSSAHMAGELFQQESGVTMLHVPYRGNSDAITALMGEQVDILFSEIGSVAQAVQQKRLKGLGVASKERFSGAKDLPTISETGLPGFEASGWLGVMAPAGTPMAIVNTLNESIQRAFADPVLKDRLASIGAEAIPGNPQEFSSFIEADLKKWNKVVRQADKLSDQN